MIYYTPYRNLNPPPPPNYNYHKNNFQGPNIYKEQSSAKPPRKKETLSSNNSKSTSSPSLNILGISLYFDDILLICLILFLCNEKITDNYLLLALILLLLD